MPIPDAELLRNIMLETAEEHKETFRRELFDNLVEFAGKGENIHQFILPAVFTNAEQEEFFTEMRGLGYLVKVQRQKKVNKPEIVIVTISWGIEK